MIIFYVFCSGLAGVYTEFILKRYRADSILIQNIYLYFYGSLFNAIGWSIENYNTSANSYFTDGFSVYTWIIIVSQSFNGLLMSIVMKYSNNITKLFVTSTSIIITVVFGVLIFSLKLNIYFYTTFILVVFSLFFYSVNFDF